MTEPHTSPFADARIGAILQRCLDERRDPLDEPLVSAWLVDHPCALPAFARLLARVQSLELAAVPAVVAPTPHRRRTAAAILAAVTIAMAAWSALPAPELQTPAAGRVLSWTLCEHRPPAGAAIAVAIRQRLLVTGGISLEVLETWSQPR